MISQGAIYMGGKYVFFFRGIVLLSILLLFIFAEDVQRLVNTSWKFLLDTWLFNSVYFETFFATFCYGVIVSIYPKTIHSCRFLDKYKISKNVQYVRYGGITDFFQEVAMYITPLMILDTFMVKKYHGVEPSIWVEKRSTLIQTTRALPRDPPSVFQISFHLLASLIVYDALFFVIHFTLHKNYFLYKNIHARHHDHDVVYAHVTNRLAIPERIALILSANEALKVFNSHPMTRMIFVPVFIAILVDNHLGYDLPFSLHRLVPFGLVGGSVKHYEHHMYGSRNYEPILTHLDKLLDKVYASK